MIQDWRARFAPLPGGEPFIAWHGMAWHGKAWHCRAEQSRGEPRVCYAMLGEPFGFTTVQIAPAGGDAIE